MKSLMPCCGVELEDVPEDGTAADFDHGLGADGGFFAETRAETAGENDGFHSLFLPMEDGPNGGEARPSTPHSMTCRLRLAECLGRYWPVVARRDCRYDRSMRAGGAC